MTGANDAVALGSGASITGTGTNADDSMSIGKSATVATAKDAMALGTSASVASGADNAIAIGNTAKANTSNTTAIGYHASATGAGAVARLVKIHPLLQKAASASAVAPAYPASPLSLAMRQITLVRQ